MKIAVVIGTRPEIIRLSLIIKKIKENFELLLIHTGQNYDKNLNDIFFEQMKIPLPNYVLSCSKGNLGENIGSIISETYNVLQKENPDAMLILGDTNSSLSVISAKRLKIPIFHMEAGNRCFDFRVPEEINRKIIDHTSDINLCYTENSRKYLIHEGFTRDSVFVTGSPMKEIFEYYKNDIQKSDIMERLGLKTNNYFLVSIHREENLDLDNNLTSIITSMNHIVETYELPIIFSTHPRTKKKLDMIDIPIDPRIIFCEPFGYFDYNKLILNTKCFISDSGTVSEEAVCAQVPAVTVRGSIERPEAVENGNIIVTGIDKENIINSINYAVKCKIISKPYDYDVDDVSDRVIKIILSYYHIVNKNVWKK